MFKRKSFGDIRKELTACGFNLEDELFAKMSYNELKWFCGKVRKAHAICTQIDSFVSAKSGEKKKGGKK